MFVCLFVTIFKTKFYQFGWIFSEYNQDFCLRDWINQSIICFLKFWPGNTPCHILLLIKLFNHLIYRPKTLINRRKVLLLSFFCLLWNILQLIMIDRTISNSQSTKIESINRYGNKSIDWFDWLIHINYVRWHHN